MMTEHLQLIMLKLKWVLNFHGLEKLPILLNLVNKREMTEICNAYYLIPA